MSLTNNGVWDDSLLWDDLDSWQDQPTVDSALNGYRFSGLTVNGIANPEVLWTLTPDVLDSTSVGRTRFSLTTINGTGNAVELRPTGEGQLFQLQQIIGASGQGTLVSIENLVQQQEAGGTYLTYNNQTVILGSGTVVGILQDVELRLIADATETIASFAQTIRRQEPSGQLLYLSQRVRDQSIYTQQYKPFDIDISVGGYQIQDSELYGDIEITRAENDATQLTFSVLVPEGDVTEYVERQGKTVVFDYTDNVTGRTERIFTGIVNIPEIDFVEGIANYSCSDNRKEAINALNSTTVSGIGFWSEEVFGEKQDEVFDEVEDRLETIPYAYDMNRFGSLILTPWNPKTVADKVLTDSDVFRRSPTVEVLARGSVTNRVNIEMEFQYQRLRYREQKYYFDGTNSVCEYFRTGPPVERAMIHEALGQTSWAYKDMNMWDAGCGTSRCFGFSMYRFSCGTYSGYQEPQVDSDGNPILDSEGNQVTAFNATRYTSTIGKYTGGATWTSFLRFSQNISEKITVAVEAPQSIAQYGLIETNQTMGLEIEYDTKDYENMDYTYDLSNFATSPNGDLYLDLAYLSSANGAARWNAAYNCAVERAKTTIEKAHRDNTATFEVDIIPDLELQHTIEVNTAQWTACKGKVSSFTHTINIADREAYTTINVSLSRAIGATPNYSKPSSDAVRPQSRLDSPKDAETIQLRTVEVATADDITEDMVGAIYRQSTYNVLAAFAVNTPSIAESRDNREFTSATTIQVPVRNDNLIIRHKR